MIALTQEKRQKRINWLKDRISSMEQCRDEMPFGLSEDESMELSAYKDSLVSLTAECKYFQWKWARDENAVWTTTPIEKLSDAVSAFGKDRENVTYRMLFTAPPVPEIKIPTEQDFESLFKSIEAGDDPDWSEPDYLSKKWHEYLARRQLALGIYQLTIEEFKRLNEFHKRKISPAQEIKMPSRIENIHLRTPLEVEDMWIDRFKRLNGLGE